jgi:DNA adenine methylase
MSVECKSFDEVIPNYPNDFIYADPPYYMEKKEGDDDNKMFKAIYPNSNWAIHHIHFDHDKLRDLLHNHKGKFILSYNDCEWVRENYKDFKIKKPEWAYSYGQGETRIGKNKQNNDPKKSHEILIIKE